MESTASLELDLHVERAAFLSCMNSFCYFVAVFQQVRLPPLPIDV